MLVLVWRVACTPSLFSFFVKKEKRIKKYEKGRRGNIFWMISAAFGMGMMGWMIPDNHTLWGGRHWIALDWATV